MTINKSVKIEGRELNVRYSRQAIDQIELLQSEINLAMELNFSCLVKKTVYEVVCRHDALYAKLDPYLTLSFKAITTSVCVPEHVNKYEHNEVKVLEIIKPERFIPDWVNIDFSEGKWGGEFGYISNSRLRV